MSKTRNTRDESAAAGTRRSPRTIRFLDSEWARIEAAAKERGAAPAEFVRSAALFAVEQDGVSVAVLAPLIERTFRLTYLMATKMREEMIEAGEREKLEGMIESARRLQAKLSGERPD